MQTMRLGAHFGVVVEAIRTGIRTSMAPRVIVQ
jgi:hypothetical protein